MGLFSSKTKTYVSSAVWNMAGEPDNRPNLLPSLVLSATLSNSSKGLGEHLQSFLRSSTAMRNQMFFRWARDFYDLGMPTGSVGASVSVRGKGLVAALGTVLGIGENQKIVIGSARVDDADVDYWAEHWVSRNHPTWDEEAWSAELNMVTAQVVISHAGIDYSMAADPDLLWGSYRNNRKLLYVSYQVLTRNARRQWIAGNTQLFTYRMGSGNATFDALRPVSSNLAEFFPAIPVRIENQFVTEMGGSIQDAAEKAYRKLTGAQLSELIPQLEDHDQIGDMDHIFLLPAVTLNAADTPSQCYLYEFFKSLIDLQVSNTSLEDFIADSRNKRVTSAAWKRWKRANDGDGSPTNPRWNKIAPALEALFNDVPDRNEIHIRMPDLPQFDFIISWTSVEETHHVGNAARFDNDQVRPKLKLGEYLICPMEPVTAWELGMDYYDYLTHVKQTWSRFAILRQHSKRRYSKIVVTGLMHQNFVYGDKNVRIYAEDVLEEEDESGFLIPLHYPTLKKVGALKGAELAGVSTYLVINSYKQVKQKWYQRGFFKIVLFAVSIAISVISGGAGLATVSGLLGTNAAVGAALGASAATAAMVGAVANGIASVILTTILSKISVLVLGEKWGAILGTIVSMVAMQVGKSLVTTGSFNVDWSVMFRPENLTKLTDAVGDAYSRWIAADTADIMQDMTNLGEEYAEKTKELEKLWSENLGMTNVVVDPMMFSDATEQFGESSESFLGRTLLTGSELAELSRAMVTDFVAISLELPGLT
jgi:hypothetical protein